jgi:hypothetical protein
MLAIFKSILSGLPHEALLVTLLDGSYVVVRLVVVDPLEG